MKRAWVASLTVTALAAASCEPGGPMLPSANPPGEIRQSLPGHPNLVQTVRITPAAPASGDTIVVTTVLTNVGSATSQPLEVSICGPGLRGSLSVTDPFARCAGFSMQATLAPGDSTLDAATRVVESGPGRYVLEVNQVRRPETWLPVTVRVRAR